MRFGMGMGLGLGAQRRSFNPSLYTLGLKSIGTGMGQQTILLGNSAECTIYLTTGIIASVSAGTVAPDGKSATLTPIADSGDTDCRTVTLAAYGAGDVSDSLVISGISTLHRLGMAEGSNGFVINHSGALPTGLTYLHLNGSNINWTYSGALPTGLTYLLLSGAKINWTYSGALPTDLTYLILSNTNANWTYNGALPTDLTYLYLSGANINWTGTSFGTTPNIATFTLANYRITKLSTAELLVILASLAARSGSLPNTITINDYADYASPPQAVTDAVAYLKAQKPNITSVVLGA